MIIAKLGDYMLEQSELNDHVMIIQYNGQNDPKVCMHAAYTGGRLSPNEAMQMLEDFIKFKTTGSFT